MGPPDRTPPLPQWEFSLVPAAQRFVSKRLQECNWLQAMEGGIDSSHVSWLHRANVMSDPLFRGAKGNEYNLGDMRPVFEVVESDGGLYIGARRNAENDQYYWRITQYVLPSFTMIAPRGGHTVHGHFWIPIDDENCWAWSYDYRPDRAITEAERAAMSDGKGIHVKYVPGTFRPLANKDNDYLMDRAAQRAGTSYSGIDGIAMQDASLQESMGPIVDRTKENLVSTDNGIIMARHRLLRAAKALIEKGTVPPGVDPEHQKSALGRRGAAARQALQGRRQAALAGQRRRPARLGVTRVEGIARRVGQSEAGPRFSAAAWARREGAPLPALPSRGSECRPQWAPVRWQMRQTSFTHNLPWALIVTMPRLRSLEKARETVSSVRPR